MNLLRLGALWLFLLTVCFSTLDNYYLMLRPKPTVLVYRINSDIQVSLKCPDGYVGTTTWNTDRSLTKEEQLNQYIEDASKGVCEVQTPTPKENTNSYPSASHTI